MHELGVLKHAIKTVENVALRNNIENNSENDFSEHAT